MVHAGDLSRFLPEALATLPRPAPRPAPAAEAAAPLVRDYQSATSHDAPTLQDALARHQGNQSRAAQSLGLTLRQFSYRLRKAGLR